MVTLLSLLAACSADFEVATTEPVLADAPGALVASSAEGGVEAAALSGRTLSVLWLSDATGTLEVRAFRDDGAGDVHVGDTIATATVSGSDATLTLPPTARRADRGTDAWSPVRHVLSLRTADGRWAGVSDIELVHLRAEDGSGGLPGWNLYDTHTGDWYGLDTEVPVGANLLGAETLALSGTSAVSVPGATHLEIAADDDTGAAFDLPVGPTWTLALDGAPAAGVFTDESGLVGGSFHGVAYDDTDGDNRRTQEDLTGALCAGYDKAELTWFADPADLPAAVALRDLDVRAGWDIRKITQDGDSLSLAPEERDLLQLLDACK